MSSDPGGRPERPGSAERPHGAERPADSAERPADGAKRPAEGMRRWGGGMTWRADPEDRPGDPACLLPRVCQACGAVADEDPPTTCPACGSEIPGA